jgi:hypothetical protein
MATDFLRLSDHPTFPLKLQLPTRLLKKLPLASRQYGNHHFVRMGGHDFAGY